MMEATAMNDIEEKHPSGTAELVIGSLMMLVGLGLFVYAFQSAVSDLPYTASAWLFGLALSAPGVFIGLNGMRKQRVAAEAAQEKADAEAVATQAIERARRK